MAVKFYVWNSYIEYLDQVYFFFVVLIIIKTPETALRWTCIWDTSVTWMVARWWLPYYKPPFFHCYWEDGQGKHDNKQQKLSTKNMSEHSEPKGVNSVSPLQS